MFYISIVIFTGILSGILSIYFRIRELKENTILTHKQLVTQVALLIITCLIFREYFTQVRIDLGFIELGWFLIYLIFSSASFYAVQVVYEYISEKKLFATADEMEAYLERLRKENDM